MNPEERYATYTRIIRSSLLNNSFDDAYRSLNQYITLPDDGQTETRKQQMIEFVTSMEMLDKDPKIQRLLTGGNRHTKRTKRTMQRKIRKSLIRRRR